jgi:hypothetical protein
MCRLATKMSRKICGYQCGRGFCASGKKSMNSRSQYRYLVFCGGIANTRLNSISEQCSENVIFLSLSCHLM